MKKLILILIISNLLLSKNNCEQAINKLKSITIPSIQKEIIYKKQLSEKIMATSVVFSGVLSLIVLDDISIKFCKNNDKFIKTKKEVNSIYQLEKYHNDYDKRIYPLNDLIDLYHHVEKFDTEDNNKKYK